MGTFTLIRFTYAQVFLCNLASHFTGLTNILFHIMFGCVCVNTELLPEETSYFLATFSELAIIIIMFALGVWNPPRDSPRLTHLNASSIVQVWKRTSAISWSG